MIHIKKSDDRDNHNIHNEYNGAEHKYDIFRVVSVIEYVANNAHRLDCLKGVIVVVLGGNNLAIVFLNQLHGISGILRVYKNGTDCTVGMLMLLTLFVLVMFLTVIMHIPKGLDLSKYDVIKGRMAFFKDTNDGDSLGMLIRTAC